MFGTYQRLRVPVSASNTEVIRKARRKLKKAYRNKATYRAQRHMFYRSMLKYHAEAQTLVTYWRL